jgi:hypothetical protein
VIDLFPATATGSVELLTTGELAPAIRCFEYYRPAISKHECVSARLLACVTLIFEDHARMEFGCVRLSWRWMLDCHKLEGALFGDWLKGGSVSVKISHVTVARPARVGDCVMFSTGE